MVEAEGAADCALRVGVPVGVVAAVRTGHGPVRSPCITGLRCRRSCLLLPCLGAMAWGTEALKVGPVPHLAALLDGHDVVGVLGQGAVA